MRHVKQIKLVLLIRFCHIIMRMIYFFWRWYMNLPKCLFGYPWFMSFLGIDVILCSSFIALPPVQRQSGSQYAWHSSSSSVIYLRYLYRAHVAMPVPTAINNISPFFVAPKDDKNLVIQAQVAKALFVLQILDSIQALLHQHFWCMPLPNFFSFHLLPFRSISIPFIPCFWKLFEC